MKSTTTLVLKTCVIIIVKDNFHQTLDFNIPFKYCKLIIIATDYNTDNNF